MGRKTATSHNPPEGRCAGYLGKKDRRGGGLPEAVIDQRFVILHRIFKERNITARGHAEMNTVHYSTIPVNSKIRPLFGIYVLTVRGRDHP
jgi:hypothetical protein